MNAARPRRPWWLAAGALAPAASLTSCGLLPKDSHAQPASALTLPAVRSTELIVITDPEMPSAVQTASALLVDTARAGEHVIIIDDRGGALLASSVAPTPPNAEAPKPPAPLPADPTSFQRARYTHAVQQYQKALQQASQAFRYHQQAELTSWMEGVAAQAQSRARQLHAGLPDITTALAEAAADLSSLRQSGYIGPQTIVICGISSAAAPVVLSVSASLLGSTVIVSGFPGTDDDEAAWQAALDQAGASRTVILTPATGSQLTAAIRQGLDGAVTDTLTSVLFGLGSSALRAGALPQLRRLLRLLTVTYPNATATIDGFTDSLPTPGGNLQLSQRRARAVLTWLVANGVGAGRLQAVGFSDTDPVAPNTADGQPLNRRVVVIIDPVTGS